MDRAAAALWTILVLVARIQTATAGAVTNVLLVLALPITSAAVLGAAVQASARPRRTLVRGVSLLVGLLIGVALLEFAAAIRLVHWELIFMFLRNEQQQYVPDADLGFRHAANTHWSGRPRSNVESVCGLPASRSDQITMTYDQRGFRNPTGLRQASIVLIGDSYVLGDYVSDDQVLSRLLEGRVGQSVANLGVAGYGTAQELGVLKRDAMPMLPRIVIWFFFEGNDLYNDQDFENAMQASSDARTTAWTSRHGWWRRSLIRNAYEQGRLLIYPLVPTYCPTFGIMKAGLHRGEKVLLASEAANPWTDFERDRWRKTEKILQEAASVIRKQHARLLLVYVPIKFRVYRDFLELAPEPAVHRWSLWPLPELFALFCRDREFACLDLTPLFQDAVRRGAMPYALADSHWSPEGHDLVAMRIADDAPVAGMDAALLVMLPRTAEYRSWYTNDPDDPESIHRLDVRCGARLRCEEHGPAGESRMSRPQELWGSLRTRDCREQPRRPCLPRAKALYERCACPAGARAA